MGSFNLREVENGQFRCVFDENPVYSFDVYPLDMGRSRPPEKLSIEVAECLRSEIEKRSCNPRARDLLGSCHKNAKQLLYHLTKSGYDPILHVGSNNNAGSVSGVVESFRSVRNAHQWVELGPYTVEICSEGSQSYGHMYVSKRRPNNYHSYFTLTKSQFDSLPVDQIDANNIRKVIKSLDI